MKKSQPKAIIVGFGPAGITAYRELQKLGYTCVGLEKTNKKGGKCTTFTDQDGMVTELGACALVSNYVEVKKLMTERGYDIEDMLPIANHSLDIKNHLSKLWFWEKGTFAAQLLQENEQYKKDYQLYVDALKNRTDLPSEINKTYAEYAKSRNIKYLDMVIKPIIPGFNYGRLEDVPMYMLFEYLRDSLIIELLIKDYLLKYSLMHVVHGGFQPLMEDLAKDLNVKTEASIKKIERSKDGVTVTYEQNGKEYIEQGDLLVLALSPMQWKSLGMELDDVEQECVKQLSCNPYSVAVVRVKGMEPEQVYLAKGFDKEEYGKHVNFVSTRDNRKNPKNGRLCTAYIPSNPNQEHIETRDEVFIDDIKTIKGVTDVEVIHKQVWQDYCPNLPWKLRITLDKHQLVHKTMYFGAYTLGSFELVETVIQSVQNTIKRHIAGVKVDYKNNIDMSFFTGKSVKPSTKDTVEEKTYQK